jgi:thioredoxin 1
MPIFDAPINTDDVNLQKVVTQALPVILHLYRQPDTSLNATLAALAKDQAGKLLVARVDANQNQQVYAYYKQPSLPAIFAIKDGDIQSFSAPAQSADVKAHAAYLLGQGPKPTQSAQPASAPAPQGNGQPVKVTDGSFERDVLQSKVPVLVDFWAAWCGPCRMIAPSLDKIAQNYAGRITIAKLNVDENPRMAAKYQARSIPLLVLFKNGKVVNSLLGAHPQAAIERFIEPSIR